MLKAGWQPHTASPVWHNRVSRDPSELQRALHLPQSFGIFPSHCLFPPFVSISLHKHRIPFSSTELLRQLPGWRWKKPTLQELERCQLASAEQCATRYDHSSWVWASSCQSTRTRLSLTCMCSNQGGQYLMSTPTSDTSPVFCWDQEPYHALQLALPTLPRGETEYMPICSTHSKQAQEKVKSWWLTCYLQCFLLHTSFFLSSSFVQIGMKLRHKESLIISWTWKNACLSSPTPARFDDLTEHQPKAHKSEGQAPTAAIFTSDDSHILLGGPRRMADIFITWYCQHCILPYLNSHGRDPSQFKGSPNLRTSNKTFK